MFQVYDKWPSLAKENYDKISEVVDFKDINYIVFAGMGGSGALGDVLASIFSKSNTHVSVVKGYTLPKTVNPNSLVITSSISGNTHETLSVLNSAKKINCKLVAFCSGGKMYDFCLKNQIKCVKITEIHSPRASFTKFLYSMLKVLEPMLPIASQDVSESITLLEKLQNKISSENLTKDNPSLELGNWISQIPLIYYPWGLKPAAIRFKNSLQENVKLHAIIENVIEASHNGIVSWERKSNIQPILIEGKDDHFKTKERWGILKEYFNTNDIDFREILSVDGNVLSKIINLIYLLDYSSIYSAVLSGVDPSPIDSIDYIKSKIKQD